MADGKYTFMMGDGLPLGVAVTRIAVSSTRLGLLIATARLQGDEQSQGTGTITLTRDELKMATLPAAAVVRSQVLLVCTDALVLQGLKLMPKEAAKKPDADYLRYLKLLVNTATTLPAKQLAEVGYDPNVGEGLAKQLDLLQTTAGATHQQQAKQKTATAQFSPALSAVRDWLDQELNPLVEGQSLAFPELAARYLALGRIQHTASARRPKVLKGTTHFGLPEVVIRRDQINIPGATLRNKSGKGVPLRYYLADTATALPTADQGRVVLYRTDVYLPDLGTLGPNPNAPFLLVLQEREGGNGEYRVEYTPTGGAE